MPRAWSMEFAAPFLPSSTIQLNERTTGLVMSGNSVIAMNTLFFLAMRATK